MASVLLKVMPHDWRLSSLLAESSDLANDRDFPLMLWYGLKDRVQIDPIGAAKLCSTCKMHKVTELIIRRLSSLPVSGADGADGLEHLVAEMANTGSTEQLEIVLRGMWAGYQGRRSAIKPKSWDKLQSKIATHPDAQTKERAVLLQSLYGGQIDPTQLIQLANDEKANAASRKSAIESLATVEGSLARETLWKLLNDQFLAGAAATSIAKQATPEEAKKLAESYSKVWPPGKMGIIAGLSSKPEWMNLLLESIENKVIPLGAIDASTWRNFQLISDWALLERARKLNPKMLEVAADKEKQIHELESVLTSNTTAGSTVAGNPTEPADASRGRTVWKNICANCHKLYGEGGAIGPELTGAQRTNLRYWTENILAPSAQVATNYRLEMFRLQDGTAVNGVPLSETNETITIQTDKEKLTFEKGDIEDRKTSSLSLMPEGLLNPLTDDAKRDLFQYLMSSNQVPEK
jgi:putative heme-binding domain-containing protein